MILIDIEIQEEYLQLSYFEFFKIQVPSRLKLTRKRKKISRMLSMEFWTELTPFRILAITLSSELRLR